MFNSYPDMNRRVAAVMLGASVLTGCAQLGNEEHGFNVMQATVDTGSVSVGADLHYDPSALLEHNDGGSNKCTKLEAKLVLDGKAIVEPVPNDDVNGPWTGLLLSTLPSKIRKDCSEDNDSVVWVRTKNVHASIDPTSFVMLAK